jgi:hypothetical protein
MLQLHDNVWDESVKTDGLIVFHGDKLKDWVAIQSNSTKLLHELYIVSKETLNCRLCESLYTG